MKNSDLVVMTTAEAKPGKEKIVQQALCDVAKAGLLALLDDVQRDHFATVEGAPPREFIFIKSRKEIYTELIKNHLKYLLLLKMIMVRPITSRIERTVLRYWLNFKELCPPLIRQAVKLPNNNLAKNGIFTH